ncbi:hypothetical protein P692DRAFT_20729027, partial [Suillus brevipes Sb2]
LSHSLGHLNAIFSVCLSPGESHLLSAARDCSVRIRDLMTNQPVGDPLVHNDEARAVVISPVGKITVWSLEAALKHSVDDHVSVSMWCQRLF